MAVGRERRAEMAELKLDRALNELKEPACESEVISSLPCDLCSLKHTRVIATRGERG